MLMLAEKSLLIVLSHGFFSIVHDLLPTPETCNVFIISHCIQNQVKFCIDMYTICTCGRQDIDVSTILYFFDASSSLLTSSSLY